HRDRRDRNRNRRRTRGLAALQSPLEAAKLGGQVERGLESIARLLLETTRDDALQVGGEIGPQGRERRRSVVEDRRAHLPGRVTGERAAAGRQLVDEDAERKE